MKNNTRRQVSKKVCEVGTEVSTSMTKLTANGQISTANNVVKVREPSAVNYHISVAKPLPLVRAPLAAPALHEPNGVKVIRSLILNVDDTHSVLSQCETRAVPDSLDKSLNREPHAFGEDELVSCNASNFDHVTRIEENCAAEILVEKRSISDTSKECYSRELHDLAKNNLVQLTALDTYGGYDDDATSEKSLDLSRELHVSDEGEPIDAYGVDALKASSIDSTETTISSANVVPHDQRVTHELFEESIHRDLSCLDGNEENTTFLTSEKCNIEEVIVDGRRVVDIDYLFQQLHKKFDSHKCPFGALKLFKSVDRGLRTELSFVCKECNYFDKIWTNCKDDNILGINESAVCGTIMAGIGCSTFQEVLAAMGIPFVAQGTYLKYRNVLYDKIDYAAKEEMKKAAALEKKIAIEKGHVIGGVPYIKVTADGAWAKRSFAGGKHDSLSGVAVIIGYETGMVLYIGVRNKYCALEAKAEQLDKDVEEHVCFKNWGRDQSSTSMEKDIIVEGFKCSLELHGLIYKTLIADGDASTHQAIRDANPYAAYGVLVEKHECNNHLFRNLCKKIKTASTMNISRTIAVKLTKSVTATREYVEKSGLKIRYHIERARDLRNLENVSNDEKRKKLEKDIFNILEHVFGEHSACIELPYACEPEKDEVNLIPDLRLTSIYSAVYEAVRYLSGHANSLLENVTSNMAEAFHSIVNKGNAGKRTNQCFGNSYEIRCLAAVVQYNTQSGLSNVHLAIGKRIPTAVSILERSRQLHVSTNKSLRQERGKRKPRKGRGTDKDYGPQAQKPDVPDCTFKMLAEEHLNNLRINQENRVQIERETRSQSDCELWHTLRIDLITASKFGEICRMQQKTSCARIVRSIRYPKVLDTAAVRFGVINEEAAIKALEVKLNVKIQACGLFIDSKIPYLGASPDGLIDPDGIVEIKCPFSAKDIPVEDAIASRPGLAKIFDKHKKDQMSKSHTYFYQVQGQLHITKRKYCIFALWTSIDVKHVKVERDEEFWHSEMEPFLSRFYMECLLPEIVDRRANRNMAIRDPEYILRAKADAERRKHQLKPNVGKKRKSKKQFQELGEKYNKLCRMNDITDTAIVESSPQKLNDDSVEALKQNCHNANWVTIELSDDENDNDEHITEMIATIETARRNISVDEVLADILPDSSLLNDSSIDWFLEIVRENSSFDQFNAACYTGYYTCIKPCEVSSPDMQIIGGNKFRHWCCVYYDKTQVTIYDSLGRIEFELLHHEENRYIQRRYGNVIDNHASNVYVAQVTKQPDSYSCGVYSAAFATTVALGGNPENVRYSRDEKEMRRHLITIIRSRKLLPFPVE